MELRIGHHARVRTPPDRRPQAAFGSVPTTCERTDQQAIRWMNVTRYLKNRSDKQSRQIVFDGEPLTMEAVWKLRDGFFPPRRGQIAGS